MRYTVSTTLVLAALGGVVLSAKWEGFTGNHAHLRFLSTKPGESGIPDGNSVHHMKNSGTFALKGGNKVFFIKRQGSEEGGHESGGSGAAGVALGGGGGYAEGGHSGGVGHGGFEEGGGEEDAHAPKFLQPQVRVIRVHFPQPYAVAFPKPYKVNVPQPYAVHVPFQQRVMVPVIKHVQVPVDKPYHVTVEKHVPEYIEKPYPITVEKHEFYDVPRPYPVHVPIYKHVYLGHGHEGKGGKENHAH